MGQLCSAATCIVLLSGSVVIEVVLGVDKFETSHPVLLVLSGVGPEP